LCGQTNGWPDHDESIGRRRNFPVFTIFAASERSVGKEIIFKGKAVKVVSVKEAVDAVPEFAIFSAGAFNIKGVGPLLQRTVTVVIDNSFILAHG